MAGIEVFSAATNGSGYTVKHRNFEIEILLLDYLPNPDPIAEKAMGSDLRSLTCLEQTVMRSRAADFGLTDSLPAAIHPSRRPKSSRQWCQSSLGLGAGSRHYRDLRK